MPQLAGLIGTPAMGLAASCDRAGVAPSRDDGLQASQHVAGAHGCLLGCGAVAKLTESVIAPATEPPVHCQRAGMVTAGDDCLQ